MTLETSLSHKAKGRPMETSVKEYCPRCHGSMMLEFDFKAGYHRSCINCGYIKYLQRPAVNLNRR